MKLKFPGAGLLKRFKKGGGDFEDDFEDDEDFDEDSRPQLVRPSGDRAGDKAGGNFEDDFGSDDGYDDEDMFEGGGARLKRILAPFARLTPKINALLGTGKRRVIGLSAVGVVGLLLVGGIGLGVYMAFSGDEADVAGLGAVPGEQNEGAFEGGFREVDGMTQADQTGEPGMLPPSGPRSLNEIAAGGVGGAGTTGVKIASVPSSAFNRIPVSSRGEKPLSEEPEPGLLEKTGDGLLPRIGLAGRMPWQVYARADTLPAGQPRVAVIITGLGLSGTATEAAIRRLPGAVTLAFDPYGIDLEQWVPVARQAGHELLMTVPMATEDFPVRDPGPDALQVSGEPQFNVALLEKLLGRMTTYVGVLSSMGSSILTRNDMLQPLLQALKDRGLMFVDSGEVGTSLAPDLATDLGLPRAVASMRLDRDPSRAAIDALLKDLERLARSQAFVVVLASPYPTTLERLNVWFPTLAKKGIVLAPITALADKKMTP